MAVDVMLAFDVRYVFFLPVFGQLGTDLKVDTNGHIPPHTNT